MKSKLGISLIIIGLIAILGAAFLYYYNISEENSARNASEHAAHVISAHIAENKSTADTPDFDAQEDTSGDEIPVIEID